MPHTIGIDVGTTNVKVVLVDAVGGLVASAARSLSTLRGDESAEQDAEALWSAVQAGIAEVVAAAPDVVDQIVALGCCSQYSSIVPVRADARPAANMVLWQDKRGTDHALSVLGREGAPETWLERHGVLPIGDGLSLAHILHFQLDRPDVHASTAAYLEPMDYVNARLTGRIVANQATMFMSLLCDNRRLDRTEYDDRLLELSGVDPSRLPPLDGPGSPVDTVRPVIACELGLPDGVLVVGGMNDSHADMIATGALAPGRAGLSIGTTSVLIDVVGHDGSDLEHGVVAMPSPFGTYLVWAETGIGGRALEFVLDSFVHAKDEVGDHRSANMFEGVEAAIERAPAGSNGVLFLPWLDGSLSPRMNASMRGGFLNLSLSTRRIDLIRAVAEGVGHSIRWLMPFVETFSGQGIEEVAFLGGAARSPAWGQVLADVLDRPILSMLHPEYAVAQGVARYALERQGSLAADRLDSQTAGARRYEPSAQHQAVHERMQEQVVAAFDAVSPISAALNA